MGMLSSQKQHVFSVERYFRLHSYLTWQADFECHFCDLLVLDKLTINHLIERFCDTKCK